MLGRSALAGALAGLAGRTLVVRDLGRVLLVRGLVAHGRNALEKSGSRFGRGLISGVRGSRKKMVSSLFARVRRSGVNVRLEPRVVGLPGLSLARVGVRGRHRRDLSHLPPPDLLNLRVGGGLPLGRRLDSNRERSLVLDLGLDLGHGLVLDLGHGLVRSRFPAVLPYG